MGTRFRQSCRRRRKASSSSPAVGSIGSTNTLLIGDPGRSSEGADFWEPPRYKSDEARYADEKREGKAQRAATRDCETTNGAGRSRQAYLKIPSERSVQLSG